HSLSNLEFVGYTPKTALDYSVEVDADMVTNYVVVNGYSASVVSVLGELDYRDGLWTVRGDLSTLILPAYIYNMPVRVIAKGAFYSTDEAIEEAGALLDPAINLNKDTVATMDAMIRNTNIPVAVRKAALNSRIVKVVTLTNLQSIEESAFENAESLASFTIADTVVSIGAGAFAYAEAIEEVIIAKGNNVFFMEGAVLFADGGNTLHTAFDSLFTTFYYETERASVAVKARAFDGVKAIQFLTVPIRTEQVGSKAFANMPNLEEIYFASNLELPADVFEGTQRGFIIYAPQGDALLSFSNRNGYEYVAWNPAECFTYTVSNKQVTITGLSGHAGCSASHNDLVIPMFINGNKVVAIGDGAFESTTSIVRSVTIPTSVKSIGASAFAGCTDLSYLYVPYSVTSIGDDAFAGCSSLIELVFVSDVDNIGNGIFAGVSADLVVYYSANRAGGALTNNIGVYTLRAGVNFNTGTPSTCFVSKENGDGTVTITALKSHNCGFSHETVVVPNYIKGKTVEVIGAGAFAGSQVRSVTIGSTVKTIEVEAFNDCAKLTSLSIVGNP
ncbi:MAG: leucine-rich repeat protein, partial [Clostridia bacterium]|nr:leucine-rich repeat protein [Clostridia bacterium]